MCIFDELVLEKRKVAVWHFKCFATTVAVGGECDGLHNYCITQINSEVKYII